MKLISGGVCAATGFTANGIHCGIRKNRTKRDLSLIYSEVPASAAAVYTTNLVKGAPLTVTKQHLADGKAQAVICNSGNANTCNANGLEIAQQMSDLLAQQLGISGDDVVVASTGVIGQTLDITPIANGIPALVSGLSKDGSQDAAYGIKIGDRIGARQEDGIDRHACVGHGERSVRDGDIASFGIGDAHCADLIAVMGRERERHSLARCGIRGAE